MANLPGSNHQKSHAIRRFWQSALSFWRGATGWKAWMLTCGLVAAILLQLLVQYLLNFWNRDFFDALSRRDSAALWTQGLDFLPLAAASVALTIASVWGRMTIQRKWREWLTLHVMMLWMPQDHSRSLKFITDNHQVPEHRIAEDGRLATDAPVELSAGLFSALLTSVTFIIVLWRVGGDLKVDVWGTTLRLHGYLVIAVVCYSAALALATMTIGRRLVEVVEGKNQAEAEFRAMGTHLRERSEAAGSYDGSRDRGNLVAAFREVITRWRQLCFQLLGTALISHVSVLSAPVIAWILCAPKYLAGDMSLGEFTQAAAAFVAVQTSFSWFVDNYPRLADWTSSAGRVGSLLLALDELDAARSGAGGQTGPGLEHRRV